MTREHLAPARRPIRTGLSALALAAALAVATSACQSTSNASAVGQNPTTSTSAVSVPASTASTSVPAPVKSSSVSSAPSRASSSKTSARAADGAFRVGQRVKAGDYTVTVHKVTYPYTNGVDQPDSGKAYILLDVEVGNVSSESQIVASLVQLQLRDSTGATYSESLMLGVNGGPPEGNVAAGHSLRGLIAYQVPVGAKGLELGFLSAIDADKVYIDLGQ